MSENTVRPKPSVRWSERRFVGRPVADVHGRRRDVPLLAPVPGLVRVCEALTPSFYIDLGRPCNSACLYCAVPPHEDAQGFLPLAEVGAIVAAGRQVGCDRAILIGGEPTLYPHLSDVLDLLREAGLPSRHIVMTNGLKLADVGLVESLREGGVSTFHVSIDTADSATYDRLSRSTGRLERQLRGLDRALQAQGALTYVYTATTRINAPTLPDLLRDLHDRAQRLGLGEPPAVLLAVVKPLGDGLRHADQLLLAPREAADRVAALVELGDRLGVCVGFRNVQACLLPELVARNVDYYLDDFSVEVATGQRVTYSHAAEYWKKPAGCQACGHRDLCTGIYHDTEKRFGIEDYRPIDRQGLR